MELARVLFIGRTRKNRLSLANALKKHYAVTETDSGKAGIEKATEQSFDIVILDAASMRTPGERVCEELRSCLPQALIVHIHPGPKKDASSAADTLLFEPLTGKRLLNYLERMLRVQDTQLISCGPFAVDLVRRMLIVNGHETRVTPKQALLVEVFLRNPGVTLERRILMEKVWQTDYMGDTRTLDVHIRWLREAIETDPGTPRYLLTVRGVGYRLEIPPELLKIDTQQAVPA